MERTDNTCLPWPFDPTCCDGIEWFTTEPVLPPDPTPEQLADHATWVSQQSAIVWATNVLWKRTGRRIGVCRYTVRICPPCGCFCYPCGCGPKARLDISPELPLVEVVSVTRTCNDTVVPVEAYDIIDSRWIALNEHACTWGTWYDCPLDVVFDAGWTPDPEAVLAMSTLACERYKQCAGMKCRLPEDTMLGEIRRGGSGNRRNITLFGIPVVDHFLIDSRSTSPAGMFDPSESHPYAVG